jgi:hypothetical protein
VPVWKSGFGPEIIVKLQAHKFLQLDLENTIWMSDEPTYFTVVLGQNWWTKKISCEEAQLRARQLP